MQLALRPAKSSTGLTSSPDGAILLEVVLALVLFVGAAAVLSIAFHASMEGAVRQKRQLHAANLAITVMSEIQLGIRTAGASGPEPFKLPFADWTWQIVPASVEEEAGESTGLTKIEVIIRNTESSIVHRLYQVLPKDRLKGSSPTVERGVL